MRQLKRLSLQSLIMIVSVFAVMFSYEVYVRSESGLSNREQFVNTIMHAGGKLSLTRASWPTPFQTRRSTSVTIPDISMDRFSDEQLESLVNLPEIIIPNLQCPRPGEVERNGLSCSVHVSILDFRHSFWCMGNSNSQRTTSQGRVQCSATVDCIAVNSKEPCRKLEACDSLFFNRASIAPTQLCPTARVNAPAPIMLSQRWHCALENPLGMSTI